MKLRVARSLTSLGCYKALLGARKRIKKAPSVDDGAKRVDALGVVARICLRSKHIH